ncbi:MAG: hypothetical protein WAU91_21315, partial [Desulfatitalea sp.]
GSTAYTHQNFSGAGEENNGISGWTLVNMVMDQNLAIFVDYIVELVDLEKAHFQLMGSKNNVL